MMLFLCGKGQAFGEIVVSMAAANHKIAVFTHDDDLMIDFCKRADIYCTTEPVNRIESWPWKPAAIASIGYLHIIKAHVLQAVKRRVFNCHYALLPNHRGRSSVPWAIIDGDSVTGITYHWIDEGIDTGNILLQATCTIDRDETQATLFQKLHALAVAYWPAALKLAYVDVAGVAQAGVGVYAYAGAPYAGIIDPAWSSATVERFIRAMTYPPLPYATYKGKEVKTFAEYRRMLEPEIAV